MDKFLNHGVLLLLLTYVSAPLLDTYLHGQEPESTDGRSVEAPSSDRLTKARQSLAKGQLEEGVSLLRSLIEADPDRLEARLLLGSTLALLARRAEAIQELEQVIRQHPGHAPAYLTLGQILVRFGDIELGRQAFERGAELDPGSSQMRLNLALTLAQLQEFEEAGEHLDKVIEGLAPSKEAAYPHYLRGKIFNELNQTDKAAEQFQKAVDLRPDYAEAYLDLGLTWRRLGRHEEALEAFQKAARLDPERPDANHYLGREYLALNQTDPAVDHLKKALEATPDDTSIMFSLARAYQLQGNREEAMDLQQQLANLRRRSQELRSQALEISQLNHKALELEKQGQLEEAEAKFREALRIDPNHMSIRANLGLLLCRTGRWKEGITELRRAHELHPEDPRTRKALAVALDRAKEAGIDLVEVESDNPDQE